MSESNEANDKELNDETHIGETHREDSNDNSAKETAAEEHPNETVEKKLEQKTDKHRTEASNSNSSFISNNWTATPLPERLPRPTFWPAALSLAVTLLAFGVVTSWIISLVGLMLFVVSATGWFMELRYEQLQ